MLFRVAGLAVLATLLGTPAAFGQEPPRTIPAAELVAQVSTGKPVNLADVRVDGIFDLSERGSLNLPLRCIRCEFDSIKATDVVFERIVDLSGSTIEGAVDLTAAVFKDRALFEEGAFKQAASFVSTRFQSDVSFSGVTFNARPAFSRAQMGAAAVFTRTEFAQGVDFTAAQFQGNSTFARSKFVEEADFSAAMFADSVTFARAEFTGSALFKEGDFRSGGSFVFGEFEQGFTFEGVNAAGLLNFKGAQIYGGKGRFLHFTSSGTVSFLGIAEDARLSMSNFSAKNLLMDPQMVASLDGGVGSEDSIELLKQIEASARERQDLYRANDAHFEATRLENDSKVGAARAIDLIHREIFGYLVRPLRPLLALLAMIILAGSVRSLPVLKQVANAWGQNLKELWRGAGDAPSGSLLPLRGRLSLSIGTMTPVMALKRPVEAQFYRVVSGLAALGALLAAHRRISLLEAARSAVLFTQKAAAAILEGIAAGATVAVRRKPSIERADSERVRDYLFASLRWGEFLTYKVLIAAFILALGNSNATISQLFSAVVG